LNLLVPGVLPFLDAVGVEPAERESVVPQILQVLPAPLGNRQIGAAALSEQAAALQLRRDQSPSSFFTSSSISSSSSSISIS
jgi:hypothetical protein